MSFMLEKRLNIEVGTEAKMQEFKKGMTNQNSKANKRQVGENIHSRCDGMS